MELGLGRAPADGFGLRLPSLTKMVTVEPGMAEPEGADPVTVPRFCSPGWVTGFTWKPPAASVAVAAPWVIPVTSGTCASVDPRTYFGSVGGKLSGG